MRLAALLVAAIAACPASAQPCDAPARLAELAPAYGRVAAGDVSATFEARARAHGLEVERLSIPAMELRDF